MDARACEKEKLFNELYQLDETDDEEVDPSPLKPFTHQPLSSSVTITPTAIPRTTSRLRVRRTLSSPLNTGPSPPSATVSMVENTPIPSPMRQSGVAMPAPRLGSVSKTFPAPNETKKAPKPGRKRGRSDSLDVVPESQKYFTGLLFYFFPNDDVAQARRARMRKAMERGALWARNWRDDVTHIIADKGLCYNDLISYLKVSALPPNVILVNEDYPADCMKYHGLVNPDQPQYHIDGQKPALKTDEPATVSSSDGSLVLKPNKGAFTRGPQTPSRTDGSEQESLRQHLREAELRALEDQREIAQQAQSKKTHDALDEAIAEALLVKDLPLELDDDDSSDREAIADDSAESHSEDERKSKKPMRKKPSKNESWQQNFNCMHKHDGLDQSQNPNRRTIEVLQQMADYYGRTHDHWRFTAYRRVIAALRKQNVKIMTKEQAIAIPFVGERLAAKIEEIAYTDKLRRLDNARLEPNDEVLQVFLNIYGVGIVQASTWVRVTCLASQGLPESGNADSVRQQVDQGFRTLDDLSRKAKLTKNQEIGLAHYEDFLARIPRKEVELHGKVVRDLISKVDSEMQVTIGGSYRRGKADSGDVDFIITKPETDLESLRTIIIGTVLPLLFSSKYLRVGLATTSKESGSKWHGAACVPGSRVWRRVDFLLVPWDEMGAALIYFTGNDIFNRSMRLLASKLGMRLNQKGLWKDVMRGKGRERITQGTLVEGRSERRIFEALGVPYRPPEHRICG